MEIILFIIVGIITFIIFKYIIKKIFICLLTLGLAAVISFIYKVSYGISLFSVIIVIFCLLSIFSELKYFGKNMIKPCKLYLNGWREKITALLFNINYIMFMGICYILLVFKAFRTYNLEELAVKFFLTIALVWVVGKSKKILFKFINRDDYNIEYEL